MRERVAYWLFQSSNRITGTCVSDVHTVTYILLLTDVKPLFLKLEDTCPSTVDDGNTMPQFLLPFVDIYPLNLTHQPSASKYAPHKHFRNLCIEAGGRKGFAESEPRSHLSIGFSSPSQALYSR